VIYSGVVVLVDVLMLVGLRTYVKKYLNVIDDFVAQNEEHIRELAEVREHDREV
jgi:hypothetical protein